MATNSPNKRIKSDSTSCPIFCKNKRRKKTPNLLRILCGRYVFRKAMRKIDHSESISTAIFCIIAFVLIGMNKSWSHAFLVTYFFGYFCVGALVGGHLTVLVCQRIFKKSSFYFVSYIAFILSTIGSIYYVGFELTIRRSLSFIVFGIFMYGVMYFFYHSSFASWYAKKELDFKSYRKKVKRKHNKNFK